MNVATDKQLYTAIWGKDRSSVLAVDLSGSALTTDD